MAQTMEAPQVAEVQLGQGEDGKAIVWVTIAAGGVAAASLAGMAITERGVFASDNSGDETAIDHNATDGAKELCENSDFAPEGAGGADAELYAERAFLPKGEITDNESAQEYIARLFNSNGPLGKSIDPASLAAVHATITFPAKNEQPVDAKYNFSKAFNETLAAYNSDNNGLARAEADCSAAHDTLIVLGQYNGSWANQGAKVTEVTALRNEQNVIIGYEFTEQVAPDTLSGIEITSRDDAKEDYYDLDSVLIASDGKMYVRGPSLEQGQKITLEEGEIPQGSTEDQQQEQNGGGGNGETNAEETDGGGGGTCGGCGATTGGSDGGTCGGCGATGGDDGGETTGGDDGGTTGGDTGGDDGGEVTTTTEDKGEEPICVPNPPYVFCPAVIEVETVSESSQQAGDYVANNPLASLGITMATAASIWAVAKRHRIQARSNQGAK